MIGRLLLPGGLLALAAVLYTIAASAGAGWLYTIPAALVGLVVVSLAGPLYGLRGIEVRRLCPPVATAGRPLRCTLVIANAGRLPRYLLEVEDTLAAGYGGAVVPRIKGKEEIRVEYELWGVRRGIYEGGELRLSSSAPFGILSTRRRVWSASRLTVRPPLIEVPPLVKPQGRAGSPGESRAHYRGGEELWGTREYRHGDPARLVAWRKSARTLHAGELAVTEFADREERPLRLELLLSPRASEEATETAVSVAATVMVRELEAGRGVVAEGGPQPLPFPEAPDRESVLNWCAALRPVSPGAWMEADVAITNRIEADYVPAAPVVMVVGDETGKAAIERLEAQGIRVLRVGGQTA